MIGVFAAQAADVWTPLAVIGGLILLMFGWLKLDIRDLGRRLDALVSDHHKTAENVARLDERSAHWEVAKP